MHILLLLQETILKKYSFFMNILVKNNDNDMNVVTFSHP